MAEHMRHIHTTRYGVNFRYRAGCSCEWQASSDHVSFSRARADADQHDRESADTFNVARELDSGDETAAALEQFRPMEGE